MLTKLLPKAQIQRFLSSQKTVNKKCCHGQKTVMDNQMRKKQKKIATLTYFRHKKKSQTHFSHKFIMPIKTDGTVY